MGAWSRLTHFRYPRRQRILCVSYKKCARTLAERLQSTFQGAISYVPPYCVKEAYTFLSRVLIYWEHAIWRSFRSKLAVKFSCSCASTVFAVCGTKADILPFKWDLRGWMTTRPEIPVQNGSEKPWCVKHVSLTLLAVYLLTMCGRYSYVWSSSSVRLRFR